MSHQHEHAHDAISRREILKGAVSVGLSATGLGLLGASAVWSAETPAVPAVVETELPPRPELSTRVAFGSCLRDPAGGAILTRVLEAKPDAFLWLGDNIYADADAAAKAGDLDYMRELYATLAANPRVVALKKACPNHVIWDDHDFGKDNVGGSDWPKRDEVQRIFCDSWGIADKDPRRQRPGIYHSVMLGSGERTVQIIMLDGRYFRLPYGDKTESAYLGAAQWTWLEAELRKPATVRLLCSGIQIINDIYRSDESWSRFPKERKRLFDLVRSTRAGGVLLLSGDMHFSEIVRLPSVLGYDAIEFTSSGLDQKWKHIPNPRRIGALVNQDNFATVTVDWSVADPQIALHTVVSSGKAALSHTIALSALQPAKS